MMKPDLKEYPKEKQDHTLVYCIAAVMVICGAVIWAVW